MQILHALPKNKIAATVNIHSEMDDWARRIRIMVPPSNINTYGLCNLLDCTVKDIQQIPNVRVTRQTEDELCNFQYT